MIYKPKGMTFENLVLELGDSPLIYVKKLNIWVLLLDWMITLQIYKDNGPIPGDPYLVCTQARTQCYPIHCVEGGQAAP